MKVLLLGNKAELLVGRLQSCKLTVHQEKISRDQVELWDPDLIVSFGYRHVLSDEVLSYPPRGALNLHISLLPWNRGSDPNFWSWLENTPKGVTIHQMVKKLDAGPIVSQKELELPKNATLKQTYGMLVAETVKLLPIALDGHLAGEAVLPPELTHGTFHKTGDLDAFGFLLREKGWDTICGTIEKYGEENGFWKDVS